MFTKCWEQIHKRIRCSNLEAKLLQYFPKPSKPQMPNPDSIFPRISCYPGGNKVKRALKQTLSLLHPRYIPEYTFLVEFTKQFVETRYLVDD